MSLRTLAQALAFNRVAYGAQLLLAPALAGRVWVGRRAAAQPAAALSTDLFATLAAGRSLPTGPRRFAAGMAGVSTLVAAAAAVGLGRDGTRGLAPA